MGIMANPFYVDMGYSKDEVAAVSKIYGVAMTLLGAFIGGVLSLKVGVMRILMLGAVLSAGTNLMFAWLASQGHNLTALIGVVSADNLAGGIASGRVHRVSLGADQRQLFGHAICAVQLGHAAAAQMDRGLLRAVCRCVRLLGIFYNDGAARNSGAAAGVVGFAHPRGAGDPSGCGSAGVRPHAAGRLWAGP